MKKDVIISIRHQFAQKIYSGDKTVEIRKRRPNIELHTRCWIYEPKPIGKITGFFLYGSYYLSKPGRLWYLLDKHNEKPGISIKDYMDYCHGAELMYAWVVDKPCRCTPFDLHDVGINRAPQSYMLCDASNFETLNKS